MKASAPILALVLVSASFAAAAPDIGKPAPDFTLKDVNGETRALTDFKGKFVVLEWVNFGCPFVRKHYDSKNMQRLQKEFTGKGVAWLSICSSAPGKQGHMSADAAKKHVDEENATPTAYLLDEAGKVGKLYGATTTPEMFVINPEGVLVYAGAIDDRKSTDVADVATANNYVRAALEAAMEGKPVATAKTTSYGCSVKYP